MKDDSQIMEKIQKGEYRCVKCNHFGDQIRQMYYCAKKNLIYLTNKSTEDLQIICKEYFGFNIVFNLSDYINKPDKKIGLSSSLRERIKESLHDFVSEKIIVYQLAGGVYKGAKKNCNNDEINAFINYFTERGYILINADNLNITFLIMYLKKCEMFVGICSGIAQLAYMFSRKICIIKNKHFEYRFHKKQNFRAFETVDKFLVSYEGTSIYRYEKMFYYFNDVVNEIIIDKRDGFLDICRKENDDFYEKFKKLSLNDDIVSVRCKDRKNLGDMCSSPVLYYDIKIIDDIHILDTKKIISYIEMGKTFLIGGGGLIHERFLNNFKIICDSNCKKIVWGVGINNHKKLNDIDVNVNSIIYPAFLDKCDLISVRDSVQNKFPIVRCVSCKSHIFDNVDIIKSNSKITYSHHQYYIGGKTNKTMKKMEDLLEYFRNSSILETTTYHGAYWGLLMGMKVIIKKPFSNKFIYL
jgi:hypothetical protein